MSVDVRKRLTEGAAVAPALAEHVHRHLLRGAATRADGALLVAPEPRGAPLAHTFWLFPAASTEAVKQAPERLGVAIPEEYASLLVVMNGCFAYDLSLYGIASVESQGLVDRTTLNAHQLHVAFRSWTLEYEQPGAFHFGGRSWSSTENVGYFLGSRDPFDALTGGRVIGNWASLPALLAQELAEAERDYPRAN